MSPERPSETSRGSAPVPTPPACGVFVAVVGPSGAGKDTLIAGAARRFAGRHDIVFVRRVVTRPALAASEDHDSLDEAAFGRDEAAGAFCLAWAAHGLRYGLPIGVADDVRRGRIVVANVSRRILAEAAAAFGRLRVVEVTAAPELLTERIVARGREDAARVRARIARAVPTVLPPATEGHLAIDNSGDVESAVTGFVAHLRHLARI